MLLQMATFRPLKIFACLFLAALGFVAVGGLSLAAARGGFSSCGARACPAVASPVAEPGLRAHGLQ